MSQNIHQAPVRSLWRRIALTQELSSTSPIAPRALFGSKLLAICKHSSFSTEYHGEKNAWEVAALCLSMRIASHLLGAELRCPSNLKCIHLEAKGGWQKASLQHWGFTNHGPENQWGMQTRFSASVLRGVWRMAFAQNRSKPSLPVLQLIAENVYQIVWTFYLK